jgi:hypothetical protein
MGDVAFRECDDIHAGKGEAFEQAGSVFLVAAGSVMDASRWLSDE